MSNRPLQQFLFLLGLGAPSLMWISRLAFTKISQKKFETSGLAYAALSQS